MATATLEKLTVDDVVKVFRKRGWGVHDRENLEHTNGEFARFVAPSFARSLGIAHADDFWPEIILATHHEKRIVFRVINSLFDVENNQSIPTVCETTPAETLGRFADAEMIDDVCDRVSKRFEEVYRIRQEMTEQQITIPARTKFAREAMKLRTPHAAPRQLIQDCESFTLWDVFMHIRKNLLAGNFIMEREGYSPRKVPPVRAINEQLRVSEGLWAIACNLIAD